VSENENESQEIAPEAAAEEIAEPEVVAHSAEEQVPGDCTGVHLAN
jgi:hypothetical protein